MHDLTAITARTPERGEEIWERKKCTDSATVLFCFSWVLCILELFPSKGYNIHTLLHSPYSFFLGCEMCSFETVFFKGFEYTQIASHTLHLLFRLDAVWFRNYFLKRVTIYIYCFTHLTLFYGWVLCTCGTDSFGPPLGLTILYETRITKYSRYTLYDHLWN